MLETSNFLQKTYKSAWKAILKDLYKIGTIEISIYSEVKYDWLRPIGNTAMLLVLHRDRKLQRITNFWKIVRIFGENQQYFFRKMGHYSIESIYPWLWSPEAILLLLWIWKALIRSLLLDSKDVTTAVTQHVVLNS